MTWYCYCISVVTHRSCRLSTPSVLQEAASSAAAAAQAALQAAEEAATAAASASREAAEAAAATAQEEHDTLRRVLDAVNAQKADLEGKLAKAGGALNAAEELKEAK